MFIPRTPGAREGIADWRYVTTGRRNDTHVEILESTDPNSKTPLPGEIVLVDGHHYIAHDVQVRLTDELVAEGEIAGR
jgi:hypothetical protein